MSNINTVTISGNLTRDPEMRHTPSGLQVCKLRIASNRSKKNPDGDGYVDDTTFVDATVFGNFAELVDSKHRKGDSITVSGRLSSSEWEAEDGSKRSKVEVIANDVDSQAMYRKASEVAAKAEGTSTTAASSAAPAGAAADTAATQLTADDDIPF